MPDEDDDALRFLTGKVISVKVLENSMGGCLSVCDVVIRPFLLILIELCVERERETWNGMRNRKENPE